MAVSTNFHADARLALLSFRDNMQLCSPGLNVRLGSWGYRFSTADGVALSLKANAVLGASMMVTWESITMIERLIFHAERCLYQETTCRCILEFASTMLSLYSCTQLQAMTGSPLDALQL